MFVWEEANRVRYHVLVSVVLTSNTTGGTISVSIAVVRASVMLSLMRISLLRRGKECASEAVATRLLNLRRNSSFSETRRGVVRGRSRFRSSTCSACPTLTKQSRAHLGGRGAST